MCFPKDGWSFTFDLDGVEINGKILNELIGATKPNNNAPKNIKGDYDLSIHGNKIVLVDNKDGTTVEAKCHPDDGFDIGVGIKEAFKKLNQKREEIKKENQEPKLGDLVKIVDSGETYTSYIQGFTGDNAKYAVKYRYGVVPKNGTKGTIVSKINENIYFIEVHKGNCLGDPRFNDLSCTDAIYVIGKKGLRKVEK